MHAPHHDELVAGRVVMVDGDFVVIGIEGSGMTVFEAFGSDDFEADDQVFGELRRPGLQRIRCVRTGLEVRGCVEVVDSDLHGVLEFLNLNRPMNG